MIADGQGRAVAFRIAPGQAHELPHAVPLLDRLPDVPGWVVGDRGYSSHAFRQHIWQAGARPAIPAKRNEEAVACPEWIYNIRGPGRGIPSVVMDPHPGSALVKRMRVAALRALDGREPSRRLPSELRRTAEFG